MGIKAALWTALSDQEHRMKHWLQLVAVPNAPVAEITQDVLRGSSCSFEVIEATPAGKNPARDHRAVVLLHFKLRPLASPNRLHQKLRPRGTREAAKASSRKETGTRVTEVQRSSRTLWRHRRIAGSSTQVFTTRSSVSMFRKVTERWPEAASGCTHALDVGFTGPTMSVFVSQSISS